MPDNPATEATADFPLGQEEAGLEDRRQETEEALRQSRARLQRAESVAAFGNWELNLGDGFMRASRGANRIYGLDKAVFALAEAQALVMTEFRPALDRALQDLIDGVRPYNIEFRIRRAGDGEVRAIHSVAEFDPEKRTIFGVIHDITERKNIEEENTALLAQLMQAQKMESLGILAGGVAHDMNNVLGAILALASAHLTIQPKDSPAYKAFETIQEAAVRGGAMVKGLLNFARQQPSETRPLDLNAILQEEARLLEHTTLAKVHLHMDLAPGLHAIQGDGSALAHAFMNLCVNAVDAMEEGGTLTLVTRNVGEDRVEVQVEDTGSGMTPEVLEKALDPFFTTKGIGQGTGLGLSMVYSAMKAHHGSMEIQSSPGAGTRICLRFPAKGAGGPIPGAAAFPETSPPPRPLSLLLVDDDDLVLSSTQRLMEILGHAVRTAASGEEALALLARDPAPECVILDMNMPGLGGRGTLPRLRERFPSLPVLLATGRADQEALDLVATHPGVKLLAKPFSIEEVRESLRSIQSFT